MAFDNQIILDEESVDEIIGSFDKFLSKSSFLCTNSFKTFHPIQKGFDKLNDEAHFLKKILEELKFIETIKGEELYKILTYDDRRNHFVKERNSEEEEVIQRANFVYLHSLFERLIFKIFKFGYNINPHFEEKLQDRFWEIYDKSVKDGTVNNDLKDVLKNKNSKSSITDLLHLLDYTPLFNLIELLGLRKGKFKDFIKVSYEIDIYRVIRNAIAHRDGKYDSIFLQEINNIKGVNGRLGDRKNDKLKQDLLKRICIINPEDPMFKDFDIWISPRNLFQCLKNFICISIISISILTENKKVLSQLVGYFSGSFIHPFLQLHNQVKHSFPLREAYDTDEKILEIVKLIDEQIDEIYKIKGIVDQEDNFKFLDTYLVNKSLLIYELRNNKKDISGLPEGDTDKILEENLDNIDDPIIKSLLTYYLAQDPRNFVNSLKQLREKDTHYSWDFENWYMISSMDENNLVASFLAEYKRDRRIHRALEAREDLKRRRKSKNRGES